MKIWTLLLAAGLLGAQPLSAQFRISSLSGDGSLAWIDAFNPGICTLESAVSLTGDWQLEQNVYTTSSVGDAQTSCRQAVRAPSLKQPRR